MLHTETVEKDTLALIKTLQGKEYLQDFVLVGGTALALKYGHRNSVDIDLFINKDFNSDKVLESLERDFDFALDYREENTLKGFINNIKVDIIAHKYNSVNPTQQIEGVRIASTEDIIAMKLNAISGDGTRVKDFIDIHHLTAEYSAADMLAFYQDKYKQRNAMHVLKSLNYFDDVSLNDWPQLMKDKSINWETIQKDLDQYVKKYSKSKTPTKNHEIKSITDEILTPKNNDPKKNKGLSM